MDTDKRTPREIAMNNRPAAFVENPKPLSMAMAETAATTTAASVPSKTKARRAAVAKPVVNFTDDLGYGDISCYSPRGVETPH